MKFTREQHEGIYTVHAFDKSSVIINSPGKEAERDEDGRLHIDSSFIISKRQLDRGWPPRSLEAMTAQHISALTEEKPEVILLGCGYHMQLPSAEQLEALVALGVGYEVMDSAAACRTYNILAGEGRSVVAAIILEND